MEALRQQPHLRFPVEHSEDVGAVRRGIAHLAVGSEQGGRLANAGLGGVPPSARASAQMIAGGNGHSRDVVTP